MKMIHTLAMLGIVLALPATAQNAAPSRQPGSSCEKFQERMAQKLKLTDAQKAGLKGITARHQASLAAKGKAAKDARRAFQEAIQKPETGLDTLKGLNRAMADAHMEVMLERRAMRQEIRAILTPDQGEKAAWMMGRREGKRMGPGGGPDPVALKTLADEVKTLRAIVDEIYKPESVQSKFARKINGS